MRQQLYQKVGHFCITFLIALGPFGTSFLSGFWSICDVAEDIAVKSVKMCKCVRRVGESIIFEGRRAPKSNNKLIQHGLGTQLFERQFFVAHAPVEDIAVHTCTALKRERNFFNLSERDLR